MPITSIFDLIPHCPNPAPVNVIPFYDGCNWSLIQIPTGATCEETLACLTNNPAFIGTLLVSSNGSLVINGNNIEVNETWLNNNINVSLGGISWSDLTIGSTVIDLSQIFTNINYIIRDDSGTMIDVGNGDTINILGIDGMRFFVTPANTLSVGLPADRQHMQVLTWDEVNGVAYWNNNQCCAQTLSFDPVTHVLQLSGTNAVDLTSINTDNQELSIVGNLLSISQLNGANQTVDLSQVNEHKLSITGNQATRDTTGVFINIHGSDGIINNTVQIPRPAVANCADVLACPAVQNILTQLSNQLVMIGALQDQIALLQWQLP